MTPSVLISIKIDITRRASVNSSSNTAITVMGCDNDILAHRCRSGRRPPHHRNPGNSVTIALPARHRNGAGRILAQADYLASALVYRSVGRRQDRPRWRRRSDDGNADIGPNPRDEPLRKFGSWRLGDVKPINFACNLLVSWAAVVFVSEKIGR